MPTTTTPSLGALARWEWRLDPHKAFGGNMRVGDLFIFPASLKQFVAPFKADLERISLSGNISAQVPLNSLKQVGENKWTPLKNTIGDYDS